MSSASRRLVQQVLSTQNFVHDVKVLDQAKALLLDTLGVSLAAQQTPEAVRLKAALQASGSLKTRGEGAGLWGSDLIASCGDAALYNGTLAHALELDDFGGADHSGAVVFPAVLAASQLRECVSGFELIRATIAGYEVARRVLEAAGAYRKHNADGGWHSTATCGAPGAAVAAGLILQLDEDQLVDAIGLAATMVGGTWAFNADGAMSKRLHPGWAASLGVNASLWARAGISGPEFAFDAEWGGFFNTYARESAVPEKLHEDFGKWPRILRSGIKPYPCCRDNHSVIDVMLGLYRKIDGQLDLVNRIEINCIPEMYKMLSNPTPSNMVEAQLSMPYCAALALTDGKAELQRFKAENLSDHGISRVKEMITLISDASLGEDAEPLVTIHMSNGEIIKRTVPYAKGDHKNPLSHDEIMIKFSSMCEIGGVAKKAEKIASFVNDLETHPCVRPLQELLRA